MFPHIQLLQIPPRDGHPLLSAISSTTGRIPDLHRLETCAAGALQKPAGRSCRALPSHIPAFRRKCLIAILHSRRSFHRKKWDKVWAWVPSSVWAPAWEWVPALHQHRDRKVLPYSPHREQHSRSCCPGRRRNYCSGSRRNCYSGIRADAFRRIRNCCSGSRNYLIGRSSIKVIISINSSYSHLLYSTIC